MDVLVGGVYSVFVNLVYDRGSVEGEPYEYYNDTYIGTQKN